MDLSKLLAHFLLVLGHGRLAVPLACLQLALQNLPTGKIYGYREKMKKGGGEIRQKRVETPQNFPPCWSKINFSERRGNNRIHLHNIYT